jgi:hypothetical protein
LRTWKFWQILLILLNISVLITGHVEHDIRKCFSSSISPDVQRRQSLSCRRAPWYRPLSICNLVYKENWGKQMLKHSEGKLCSYSKFKTYFGLEKYLCILKSFEQRRNFTRFRISESVAKFVARLLIPNIYLLNLICNFSIVFFWKIFFKQIIFSTCIKLLYNYMF